MNGHWYVAERDDAWLVVVTDRRDADDSALCEDIDAEDAHLAGNRRLDDEFVPTHGIRLQCLSALLYFAAVCPGTILSHEPVTG
jgi:hypothetical protein